MMKREIGISVASILITVFFQAKGIGFDCILFKGNVMFLTDDKV